MSSQFSKGDLVVITNVSGSKTHTDVGKIYRIGNIQNYNTGDNLLYVSPADLVSLNFYYTHYFEGEVELVFTI